MCLFVLFLFAYGINSLKTDVDLEKFPFIHPFKNNRQLEEEASLDPLKFDPSVYLYSRDEVAKFDTSKRRSFESTGRFTSIYHDYQEENKIFFYDGSLYSGTFNLDENPNYRQIICENNKIKFISQNLDSLLELMPGARIHVGEKYGTCKDHYFMVIRRRDYYKKQDLHYLTIETELLSLNEMFYQLNLKIELPNNEKIQKNRRNDVIDIKESLMFFGFNYDEDTESCVEPNVVLFNEMYKNVSCFVVCENCWGWFDTGIIMNIDFDSLTEIKIFKIGVYGETKGKFDVVFDMEFELHKVFQFLIFEKLLPSITFWIGKIPFYIKPKIELLTQIRVDLYAELFEVKTGVDFELYADFGIVYENEEFKTFKTITEPKITIDKPVFLKEATGIDFYTILSIHPRVLFYIYGVAPLILTVIPNLHFHGDIKPFFLTNKFTYGTDYSIDLYYGMENLVVPHDIPFIGGKEIDLGDNLPWVETQNVIPKTEMMCYNCKGQVDLGAPPEVLPIYITFVAVSILVFLLIILIIILVAYFKGIKKVAFRLLLKVKKNKSVEPEVSQKDLKEKFLKE